MEKKYIIKLKENEIAYKTVNSNGCPMIGLLHTVPYIEPDLEQVRKEAYEEGYAEGSKEDYDEAYLKGYNQGLADAWEAARKIWDYDLDTLKEIFGKAFMRMDIYKLSTASEAIEKIRQYEQERDAEIKVGDEIEAVSGKAVVVYVDDVDEHKVRYVYSNGVYAFNYIDKVTKTGRHFPEIATVLEKMREEE